jgi:flagellar hook-length control protein FliK
MQSNAAMLLLAAAGNGVAAGSASPSSALYGDGDETLTGRFSDLLGDMGAESNLDFTQQFARGQMLSQTTATMLVAQEMPDTTLSAEQPASTLPQNVLITPAEAAALVQRVDKLIAASREGSAEQPAWRQLKDQLEQLARGKEPRTLAQLLDAAPAVRDTAVPTILLTRLLMPRKAPAVAPEEEEASPSAAAMMQQLQATMFRPLDRAAAGAASGTPEAPTQEIVSKAPAVAAPEPVAPTALDTVSTSAPLPMMASPPISSVSAATLSMPAPVMTPVEVSSMPLPTASDMDIDARIPPLPTAASLTQAETLPEIDLPSFETQNYRDNRLPDPPAPVQTAYSQAPVEQAAWVMQAARSLPTMMTEEPKPVVRTASTEMSVAAVDKLSAVSSVMPNVAIAPAASVHHAPAVSAHLQLMPTPGYINQAPVTDQVQVAIRKAGSDGVDRLTIQLDPVDLGRVEVNLNTGRDGQTQVIFTIDKPDTFDSLSRDARALERALQEAGIKADAGGMQFNLRQQPNGNLQADVNGQSHSQGNNAAANEEPVTNRRDAMAASPVPQYYTINLREGVDISA